MWKYIAPFLLSMVPIIELRGAVPLGIGMGLSAPAALLICIVGNMLPMPLIYFFARKFLLWGANTGIPWIHKICGFFLEKGEKAGRKLTASTGRYGTFLALMLFVGVPLPGTGAWTGTLAASLLNLGIKTTSLAVSLGVVMAGLIMSVLSLGIFTVF